MTTMPPTKLYIPKSSTPNRCNTILEVYNVMAIITNIRMYNRSVFLAIRLVEEARDIKVKVIINVHL